LQNLKISLIQSELYWQNADANRAMFEEKIWEIEEDTDLIVLPEMFTTGFTMEAEKVAEVMNLHTIKWLQTMAKKTEAVVTGSYIVKENNQYFNRLIWMPPDGNFLHYDKRHLFRMAKEHHTFSAGSMQINPTIKGWKILPLICYDLRFPVWSRNTDLHYDLLLYVANWPKARHSAWQTLLKARAIENLSYVLGVNRVGEDGKGIQYKGGSVIIDFKGNTVFEKEEEEITKTIELEKEPLEKFREKFPAHLDADAFKIIVS